MAAEAFLTEYADRELLRFLTCGSVDDGKSTLIGRLLHDSATVYEDHLRAAQDASRKHGTTGDAVDLALLVDGLEAEREQGITIDVAYRYFATPHRKFIIADTPGHEQYTRNMATGASNSDVAVILVDATRGVVAQTRRHAFIATLLGIQHLMVAVNKMDLAGWSETVFRSIREEFSEFAARLQVADIQFVPISALLGDNVVRASERMPWYPGSPLLAHLEGLHIASDRNLIDLRMPVQLVIRSGAFRGYSGTIASGVLRTGQEVLVLPSGQRARVRSILTPSGEREQAFAPLAVNVALDSHVDVSRGDMLVSPNNVPRVERAMDAMLVWMHDAPLVPGREYFLEHASTTVPATVTAIRYRMNVNTLHREPAAALDLNEIGRVRIETLRLLAFDPYTRNRGTGALILIDRMTYATVAAGMILDRETIDDEPALRAEALARHAGPTQEDWSRRLGQQPLFITLSGNGAARAAESLRSQLFRRGFLAEILPAERADGLDPRALGAVLQRLGVISIAAEDGTGALTFSCEGEVLTARDPEHAVAELVERGMLQKVR